MTNKNIILTYLPHETYKNLERGEKIKELANSTSFSVESILDKDGKIDFVMLIRFFKNNDASVSDFFQKKEHIEKIMFPFFDFLKYTFFSQNKIIPQDIVDILKTHISIQDGSISYIEEKNSQIVSSQHIEQYDTIAFHLFLLGMNQDFDLVKDIQTDYFLRINALFTDSILSVSRSLGIVDIGVSKKLPEILIRELNYCIQIGETINKLALIHAVNFEERQISFELGAIIRNNIDSLLRQLSEEFVEEHIIGKKLRYLSGKVQCNFAHGVIISGSTVHEIEDQITHIKHEQRAGFDRQKASDFGGDPREEESSKMVLMGNETITDLVGMEKIELLQGTICGELYKKKETLLTNLTHIYSYGVGREILTTEEVINDFVCNGIKNEYQIEVIYYIILFDTHTKKESLISLMEFFLINHQNNNFFYEEFVIKTIAQIVRRFHVSPERLEFLSLVEGIYISLSEKDISYSILSYSRVYLSLALYYIKCDGNKYLEHAKICFLHYKNLDSSRMGVDKNHNFTQDEIYFYTSLGGIDEMRRYQKKIHHHEDLEKAGVYVFEEAVERYQKSAIASIETKVEKIIASMNKGDDIYSQDRINDLLGKRIAETIFYNLCTITVIGDCENCKRNQNNTKCENCKKSPQIRAETCPLTVLKRGFKKTHIPLEGGLFITFIYPSISEKIFEKIFFQQSVLVKERFGNLIAINNKNTLLQRSKTELEKLAFYDTETGLPNENKLNKEISGQEKTIILIEVAGYERMIETHGGKNGWTEIMKRVAMYLGTNSGATVYRYDKTCFCLVYEPSKVSEMVVLLKESPQHVIGHIVEALLTNFHVEYGKNMQFHAGIVIGEKEEHIKYAHIALTKAKNVRKKHLYIFENGDERVPEEERRYTDILVSAFDLNNISTNLVPRYQRIHDPKNLHTEKFEALARIEHLREDGKIEILTPDKFIDIATHKRWLSDITMSMLRQIISDLEKYPDLQVSINLHEQDWNDDRIMVALRSIHLEGRIDVRRISLEILETVPFDRVEDIKKIQELKAHGFQISIDDYGENNSNLKKVMLITPHNIKIDRIIIEKLNDDEFKEGAIAAIRSVVLHAKEIGATVTAEYIETEEVFRLVQNLGVRYFQGYHFAKPLPIEEIMKGK